MSPFFEGLWLRDFKSVADTQSDLLSGTLCIPNPFNVSNRLCFLLGDFGPFLFVFVALSVPPLPFEVAFFSLSSCLISQMLAAGLESRRTRLDGTATYSGSSQRTETIHHFLFFFLADMDLVDLISRG